jgi:cytosol aminopeptidase family protein
MIKILVTGLPADQFFSTPLALPVFKDVRPPRNEAGRLNFRLAGKISKWIENGSVDPGSSTPTLFTPGSMDIFPQLVISGAGAYSELSAPNIERTLSAMVEALLKAGAETIGVAARDFKKGHMAPRDSAEILIKGIAHGCSIAGVQNSRTIRVHWEEGEIDKLVSELKRSRHHLPECKEWLIQKDPVDEEYLPL